MSPCTTTAQLRGFLTTFEASLVSANKRDERKPTAMAFPEQRGMTDDRNNPKEESRHDEKLRKAKETGELLNDMSGDDPVDSFGVKDTLQ
jgi:hypothetical protein